MRFIVDADPGHDDLITIVLAQQLADVVLVTTVSGNAPIAQVTANALVAADLAGFDGPVVRGADRPRQRDPFHPTAVHGENGMAGAERPPTDRTISGTDAAAAIVEHAERDTWILAVGPLTNVAAAIELDPDLADRVAGITMMGGAVGCGNISPVAEFNVWSDPEAADVVFRSGARLVMCGLDVTTQVRYDDDWARSISHPYVRALLGHYLRNHRYLDADGAPLHDPCALLAVTHPHWFGFEDRPVAVETRGDLTRGMTVVDRRPWVRDANVSVARTVDVTAVLGLVREVLNRL